MSTWEGKQLYKLKLARLNFYISFKWEQWRTGPYLISRHSLISYLLNLYNNLDFLSNFWLFLFRDLQSSCRRFETRANPTYPPSVAKIRLFTAHWPIVWQG